MNYIWYPLVDAIQSGFDTLKIHYRLSDRVFFDAIGDEKFRIQAQAHHISPLLEYTPVALFDPDRTISLEDKFSRVDVNPYIRFGPIFTRILDPERTDPNDLIVCDILTHILAHIDRICGMSKRDFKIIMMIDEIESGVYGDKQAASLFSVVEKRALAEALLVFYETSNGLRCLDALFRVIMTDFHVRLRDNNEVVFYSPQTFDKREDRKLRFIIDLFLPVDFPFVIHWQYTYGSIGHDESMMLEGFVL